MKFLRKRPIRARLTDRLIAIDARLVPDGRSGGVQQFTERLIAELGMLVDGPERYVLVAHPTVTSWLTAIRGSNQEITPISDDRFLRPIPLADRDGGLPTWDSRVFFQNLDVQAIHFPSQQHTRVPHPTIYCPHDLQHLHLPSNFSTRQIEEREAQYRSGCRGAAAVVMPSKWASEDIASRYNLDPSQVFGIPHGGLHKRTAVQRPENDEIAALISSGSDFALYPSQTWPHKNHRRLLAAIRQIRDREGMVIRLVCPGFLNEHWSEIQALRSELDLDQQVLFPGFVSANDIGILFATARLLIYPSEFEGGGLPLAEAFSVGLPAAVSSIPSLQEYAQGAAILFDPLSVDEIHLALRNLWMDHRLRDDLVVRGSRRASDLSWSTAARSYRAIYRHVLSSKLTEEDRELIEKARAG